MNRLSSAPQLAPPSTETGEIYDDSALDGVAANVKLLLKLIQDHKDACHRQKNDGRRMLRVATMMTILDNVRSRIQNCQFGNKRAEAELRRCNTDLMPNRVPRDSKQKDIVDDEKEKLRKALNASLAARKSLEMMCSSLGKEKEIMAIQLSTRVHQMNEMEELISDMKAQNETLLVKVKECASEHREKKCGAVEIQGNAALQERNKALSEHLQRSLDGYRSMKRKLREVQEENIVVQTAMEEMGQEVRSSLERFHHFKESIALGNDPSVDIQEEIRRLEHMFQCFQMQVTKQNQKKGECVKVKGEINACTPSVLA